MNTGNTMRCAGCRAIKAIATSWTRYGLLNHRLTTGLCILILRGFHLALAGSLLIGWYWLLLLLFTQVTTHAMAWQTQARGWTQQWRYRTRRGRQLCLLVTLLLRCLRYINALLRFLI